MEMKNKKFSWQSAQFDPRETFFRLIDSEDYHRFGIDPQDVPMGTFAAEDHPGFLPSRFGGNAYGLGLIEQSVLNRADTDFLESLDFHNIQEVAAHAKELNAIYQKLGLLMRFSLTGKLYFLIPINLVAHSLQEIKVKADEVEELIIQHIFDTRMERLDIGLLTASHDLIVHELTARLSSHRIFLFESIEKLRSWRIPLDIVILPKDPFEYLLEQKFPKSRRRPLNRQRLLNYATHLAGKIYDILEPDGKFHVLAHSSSPQEDEVCRVRFKSEEDLKHFLLFSHTFKTGKAYKGRSTEEEVEVHSADLHYYLNRFAFFEPHLKRLLDGRKPEELSLEEVNELPYLNFRLPQIYLKDPETHWKSVFEPFFHTKTLMLKTPRHRRRYWQERLEIDSELPEKVFVFVGQPRQPVVTLNSLEDEIRASGMQGCGLSLIAEYRNAFRYVLDVLKILIRIKDHDFPRLSELDLARLSNPFRSNAEIFSALSQLIGQIPRLEMVREFLNPDGLEGDTTRVLENIPKLSLLGFTGAQLREILLIIVGHTTMSRVVFGKISARSLKSITDKAKEGDSQKILDLLRFCRLMSMAEIAAALGESFTPEQAKELYRLYDDASNVATNRSLDWEKLHDLRISALGGVENKALREMLKLFNLFEFLDDWQELVRKGRFQKEVLCDYEPDMLQQMEETLALVEIAAQFRRTFTGEHLFGRSYFFRQFLDTEFHGTGHLFPKLGTRAGLILLWITVNSSERRIINFNPMLSGIPVDRLDQRIAKIKETLLRIPVDRLQPQFFEEINRKLSRRQSAFIFDSGIRLVSNPATRAIDISFVDVEENIQQIDALFGHFESRKLESVSLRNLHEMERRFSELESFHQYLQREGCYLQCGIFERSGGLEAKDREIEAIEERLKAILQRQIFIPAEIHDTLSILARHCPEILGFVLPELQALGNLVENWPTRKKQSLGAYVMRCLEKFQALVVRDRNSFQDRNAFYQLAKQEFGPLAEEGIGPTYGQMDILEYIVERIQQRPALYQALTFALIFQDIGKIEQYSDSLLEPEPRFTHAEQGALVLERSDILKKYIADDRIADLTILLVRRHGLVGRVIQGEEPVVSLEELTGAQDEQLLDVFVLHSILAASSLQEGLMVSDLLDVFLAYRAAGLQVIKSKGDWRTRAKELMRDRGAIVWDDAAGTQVLQADDDHYCGFYDPDQGDDALWQGRRRASLERLLKLLGAPWVDYQDLEMFLAKAPVNFIYHKKKLKSVGPAAYDKQIKIASKVLDILASLSPEARYYLLYCLDHLGVGMRVHDFHHLSGFLELEECIKLLLVSFQALHHHFGVGAKKGLISFRPLSQNIGRRHEILRNALRDLPFPDTCFEAGKSTFSPQAYGELVFRPSAGETAIQVDYHDTVQFDLMARSLTTIWDHGELNARYLSLVRELQTSLPYDTKSFEEELRIVYAEQQKKINDRILKTFQEQLSQAENFSQLLVIQEEIKEKLSQALFPEDQQFVLKEIFEFHRSRLRDIHLDSIYRDINALETEEALTNYWNRIKYELLSYRVFVGKEYESLIAEFIDRKIEETSKR